MSDFNCKCAGCTKSRKSERELILKHIEDAPVEMDFFGPYIARDKLIAFLKGENE